MNVQDDTGVVDGGNTSNRENAEAAEQMTIDCGSSIDISMVKKLYVQLQQALSSSKSVILNAENVECADGAGLQLLYAFFHDAKAKGINIDWKDPSAAIKRSASLLGMADQLQLNV